MRDFLKLAFVATAALVCSAGLAQVQPVPEQQLANGHLGEQNARLTSQEAPPSDSYVTRALAAIDQQDYARALAILRPHRRSHDLAYHFLSGRAHEGLGNYDAARRELTETLRRDRSFLGAQLALGLLEAEHGDRAAATGILENLRARQTECAGECSEVTQLGASIEAIEAALQARPD